MDDFDEKTQYIECSTGTAAEFAEKRKMAEFEKELDAAVTKATDRLKKNFPADE